MKLIFQAVGAVCIALLVDRGLLRYSDKIIEFWPEYGQNGKKNTTVEHVSGIFFEKILQIYV